MYWLGWGFEASAHLLFAKALLYKMHHLQAWPCARSRGHRQMRKDARSQSMEGANGEIDSEIASKRCCNKRALALGRGRPNLVRKTTSSEGSHYSGDVTCCESIHYFPNLSKDVLFFFIFIFYFIFKLYIIVLVLPNIKMKKPSPVTGLCEPQTGGYQARVERTWELRHHCCQYKPPTCSHRLNTKTCFFGNSAVDSGFAHLLPSGLPCTLSPWSLIYEASPTSPGSQPKPHTAGPG